MQEWQKRVVEEKQALDEKIKKLNVAIKGGMAGMDPFDAELLNEQYSLMLEYSSTLNFRILRFDLT